MRKARFTERRVSHLRHIWMRVLQHVADSSATTFSCVICFVLGALAGIGAVSSVLAYLLLG